MSRPDYIDEVHLEYLDELRESGETNMYGARVYLLREFVDMSEKTAGDILGYWMESFSRKNR